MKKIKKCQKCKREFIPEKDGRERHCSAECAEASTRAVQKKSRVKRKKRQSAYFRTWYEKKKLNNSWREKRNTKERDRKRRINEGA